MRDPNRTALLYHFLKQRDDRTVAAEHISEPDRDKFRPDTAEYFSRTILVGIFVACVGKQLGKLLSLPGLDLCIEALDNHLAQPLAGAHNIGRVDRLVRGNEDEALAAVHHGRICGLIGSDGIVLDGFVRTVLHERYMLVGCGVIDDLRPVFLKHTEYAPAVPDGPDQCNQVKIRIPFLQLHLNIIGVVLIDIENDELPRTVRRNLPAQFAPDGSAASGNHNGLAGNEGKDLLHIGADRLPAEQVLDGYILHLLDRDLSQHQLVHTGQVLQLAVGLLTDV